jgi:Fe-S-cluster containining protein
MSEITISVNKKLGTLLNQLYESERKTKLVEIFNYTNKLKEELTEQKDKIGFLRNSIDSFLKNIPKFPCKKGCSSCCSIPVSINNFEAEEYALLIKNGHKINKKKYELQEKIDYSDKQKPFEIFSFDNQCIFLTDNGECSIYTIRPLICRTFFVTDQNCPEIFVNSETIPLYVNFKAEIIHSFTISNLKTNYMVPFISDYLGQI